MFAYMKKYLFALAALSLLFACTPENNNNGGTKNNEDELTITGEALNVTDYSATLTGYANLPFELGDAEVGIMYDKQQSFEDARKVVATGLDGNNKFTVSVTGLEPSTTYYYKSYVQNGMAVKYGSVKSFTTSFFSVESVSLDKTEYTFNTIGNTLTLTATVLPADATDKSVSWTSDKEAVATVDANGRVNAKGNGTATITVTTKDQGKTATCIITVAQWVTSISLDKTSLSLLIGAEATFSVTSVLPDNANDKTYSWSSSDSAIASVDNSGKVTAKANGKATIKATANDGSGVFASCSVIVFAEKVDMGIKTSDGKTLYWSTRNLCESGFVNSPEDYGDYYAWGETAPKENYSWPTYKFGTSSGPFSKYNTGSSYGPIDNKTVLEPEDDVAHVKLGGKWRMPTDAEWTELRTKCTWTWTENYNGTGVAGEMVTAPNGNSIFLPAAGFRYFTLLKFAGFYGDYWSSSLNTDNPRYAWDVFFDPGLVFGRDNGDRYDGQSVRPVTE